MSEKRKKSIFSGITNSLTRWLWFKALLVILLLFCSYAIYKFQTEDSKRWATEEIALKQRDFRGANDKEVFSAAKPLEIDENFSDSAAATQVYNPGSQNNEKEDLEPSVPEQRDDLNRQQEKMREWPFPTFKKIVFFKYGSNKVPSDSFEVLDKIADFAIHNPEREFIICGYTDSTGTYSYNLTISKLRADAVKNYLIAKGVNPDTLETIGFGSQDPIYSNETAGGRQLNRRVEIELKLE